MLSVGEKYEREIKESKGGNGGKGMNEMRELKNMCIYNMVIFLYLLSRYNNIHYSIFV